MASTTTAFVVPEAADPTRDFTTEFVRLCTKVNPVNHGEFEDTVNVLVQEACIDESVDTKRARPVSIQRCRRGGKTFMLHAVAKMLSELRGTRRPKDTHIIFISLSSVTPFSVNSEITGAYGAILSRIGWELTNRESNSFTQFRRKYHDFGAVDDWLFDKKVILIVDELNIIPHTTDMYDDMIALLDNIVQRDGCAMLYSTHHRGTPDLLRGRLLVGTMGHLALSKREHLWKQIPRIINEGCLRGLYKEPAEEASFWSAVLRARLPALVLQDSYEIAGYTDNLFLDEDSVDERIQCLKAVISGDIDLLTNGRNLFRAYSYMSERFKRGNKARYAWPSFMVAQYGVLGKDYRQLYSTLEHPSIDEAKAFEALTQLAILVRLLTQTEHDLVPMNVDVIQGARVTAFDATELFYIGKDVTDISGILKAVCDHFSRRRIVQQLVAVPLFASFPVYDFFVLHRTNETWSVAAGYQCKQGCKYPTESADPSVPLSVWLVGKCRKYRVEEDGNHVALKIERGWVLLGESSQTDLFGVTVSEALPQDPVRRENPSCAAEMAYKELGRAASEPPTKKVR